MSTPSRRRRGITVKLGQIEVTKLGIARFNRHDVYHVILSLSWPAG